MIRRPRVQSPPWLLPGLVLSSSEFSSSVTLVTANWFASGQLLFLTLYARKRSTSYCVTQGRIKECLTWGGGGGWQSLVQKVLLNFFVANYFSQRRPRVSQSVNASRRWRGKDCFASRGEQIIGGHSQTITFWISVEFSLVAKCNPRFIKTKISQLKSDIRSCRCKNCILKQA